MLQSPGSRERAGVLGGCLVDCDPEFEKRARKIRRRALVVSIILQALIVAALVLFPLLSKGESLAAFSVTLAPPYHHGAPNPNRQRIQRHSPGGRQLCIYCYRSIPPTIATVDHRQIVEDPGPDGPSIPGTPEGQNIPGALDGVATHRDPPPPPPQKTQTLQVSAGVQAARLVHRVEPLYPFLPKSIHKEGQVELRAIIATDGRIKSLRVVSGDPMFIPASLSAVQEWRYQPTLLNGEPVEIETYITVVYTLNH